MALEKLKTETCGVFESIRTYHGKIFRFEEHLKRLKNSANTIGYTKVPDLKKLKKEIEQIAKENETGDDLFIRVTLWEGEHFIMVGHRKHKKQIYERGVRLKTSSFLASAQKAHPFQAKTTAYQMAVLASSLPNEDKTYEWMFLN